jgi:hypothetical protein
MASVPVNVPRGDVKPPVAVGPLTEGVEQRFRRLAAEWEDATEYISSTTEIINHPAYREIVGLGSEVVPLLLRDMEDHHTHWFWALREITGADPPLADSPGGNIPRMVQAWLNWAKENGYRW